MGPFSRKPNTLEPAPTHLDKPWFRSWVAQIIKESGVDPADDDNGIALIYMAGLSTHNAASDLMDRYGGAWAKPILTEYLQSDGATPWGAIALVAGWDRDAVPILEENLVSLAGMLVEAGQEQGKFWSPE